jgi:hypothetical protein
VHGLVSITGLERSNSREMREKVRECMDMSCCLEPVTVTD